MDNYIWVGRGKSAGTGAQQTKIVDKLVKCDDTERPSRFSTGI